MLGACTDTEMPGAILSCKVLATHGFSNHNCVTKSKHTSRRKKILKNFKLVKDQRTKSTETKEHLKVVKQRRSLYL